MSFARKICVLGDFGVGKSSLVRRYVLGQFDETYKSTLGVNVYRFSDTVEGVGEARLMLWDVEGSENPELHVQSYLKGAAGALIVGDVTRDTSVATMSAHARRFNEVVPGRPVVFAANKTDLLAEDQDRPPLDEMAAELGGEIKWTSAATGDRVVELFHAITKRIAQLGV